MCQHEPGGRGRPLESFRCVTAALCVALLWHSLMPQLALACGCFSPPIPDPTAVDFAVNQQAELLIFEVEGGDDPHVTAHVLIKYAGDPEKFAWLIPIPSVPELSLSQSGAFALIDEQTRPLTSVTRRNVCPHQQWNCRMHPPPNCPSPYDSARDDGSAFGAGGAQYASAESGSVGTGGTGGGSMAGPPPVIVHARQSVGDYETVTIGAADADAAVAWLNEEGFIVNATMGQYMQPYLDAGMLFLASKLQPNADAGELRPLKMRYAGDTPAIPLRLTAVAAEPHLTVTVFIYADRAYEPVGHPLVDISEVDIGSPDGTRTNYGAVLSRLADEAGGDGFVLEYYGPPPTYQDPNPQCCGQFGVDEFGVAIATDVCGVANNGACECPRADFDAEDCAGDTGPAADIAMVDSLAANHTRVTRLTTRLSPHEMTFDPAYRPMWGDEPVMGRRTFSGVHTELLGCTDDLMDAQQYADVQALQACSLIYCGYDGRCAATEGAAGCVCSGTELARIYTDLDGSPAVTCVPQEGTVDFSEGGLVLPDACAGRDLSDGAECFDIGGFPTVLCPAGQAAVSVGADVPVCEPVLVMADGPGARNYTLAVDQIEVCAPAPPNCPLHGWLEEHDVEIEGTQCESSTPDPSWLVMPPMPTCDNYSMTSIETNAERPEADLSAELCGCRAVGSSSSGGGSLSSIALMMLALVGMMRQRRRRSGIVRRWH